MARAPEVSAVGSRVFRELSGPEMAAINAQDVIDRLERMLHDPIFRDKVEEMFIKTGRFGVGACFPVLKMGGAITFKVFTSLEAYRSNEKLPAPFDVAVSLQLGEDRDDQESLLSGTIRVNREIGTSTETAVDAARLDAGLEVLAPARNEAGYVENKEVPESQSNPKRKGKPNRTRAEGDVDERIREELG